MHELQSDGMESLSILMRGGADRKKGISWGKRGQTGRKMEA